MLSSFCRAANSNSSTQRWCRSRSTCLFLKSLIIADSSETNDTFPDHNWMKNVRPPALTSVTMKITAFWDVMCNLVDIYWHFGETCCLHLQGTVISTQKMDAACSSLWFIHTCQTLWPLHPRRHITHTLFSSTSYTVTAAVALNFSYISVSSQFHSRTQTAAFNYCLFQLLNKRQGVKFIPKIISTHFLKTNCKCWQVLL
jgi:hypothetical protein